jgi:hypothetical protein
MVHYQLETEWGFYRPVVVRVPPNHVAHHGGSAKKEAIFMRG